MEILTTEIEGLFLFQPQVFEDERGYFLEFFRKDQIWELGINLEFVQENESRSKKNVLRGLHFQEPPFEQGKLVRVVSGKVQDVAVDLRRNSATFGQWFSHVLSDENKTLLWIPPGFAHGFLALMENTVFQYKCTGYYNSDSEKSIRWNDPQLAIHWEVKDPLISEKDRNAPLFFQLQTNF
jgi:dTDP-4-dehydrorhamnose 3,5-epimerase